MTPARKQAEASCPDNPNPAQNILVSFGGTSTLNGLERAELAACECAIQEHLRAFVEVGKALMHIKNKRLYREAFQTFGDYCRRKWDFSRSYAHRLLTGAEVVQYLLPMGNIPLPENERQVRPLLGLSPELVGQAWLKAVQIAGGKKVTSTLVQEAVLSLTQGPPGPEKGEAFWQKSIRPLLRKMSKALRAGDRDGVTALVLRISLLLEVGNRPRSDHDL